MVKHVLRQPIRKILRHVAAVVGVGAGLAVLNGDAAVYICAGYVCGEIGMGECIPEGGAVPCVARGTLVGAHATAALEYLNPVFPVVSYFSSREIRFLGF